MINRIAGVAENGRRPRDRKPGRLPALVTTADLKQVLDSAEAMIVKYPAAALAAAFFTGVAIAWWIKRK